MKHLKTYEDKIKTVKFSELGDTWSPNDILNKEKDAKFTGKKDFDLKLGQKVKDLLLEYRIGVLTVGPGDWLHKQDIILEPEKVFKENRVELGVVPSFENFIENNDMFIEDYENISVEEKEKWHEKYEDEVKPEEANHSNLAFSVFLPLNIQGATNKELCALCDATKYLKLLNDIIPDYVKDGSIIENILNDKTESFKKFINEKGIKITNDNIEDVPTINYRIYKDTKFLAELESVCGDYDISYRKLIADWLELAK
jgi:hypothetical protein